MKTTIKGSEALDKLVMIDMGEKIPCKSCKSEDQTLIRDFSDLGVAGNNALTSFTTVCNKCENITKYELIKTIDMYM